MINAIAVVGAGTMGGGIAQVAAQAGCDVVVIDAAQDALDLCCTKVGESLQVLVRRGKISDRDATAIASRISWSRELASAKSSGLVIEAIVERLDAKQRLFAALAEIVRGDTILASNTSSLSIGAMAQALPDPSRFVGLHFFNPVPVMKLVEVVAGERSDPSVVETAIVLMRSWGKQAVLVRDVPGFIVNRVARPFYAEAFIALDEGIAPTLIDAVLKDYAGFRMGPLALADLIGHDINYAAAEAVYARMKPDTRFRPQPSQQRLVEAGRLGCKTGRGVYDYAEPGLPLEGTAIVHAARIRISVDAPAFAWLAEKVGMIETIDLPADTLSVDGMLVAYGDGRRLADRPGIDILLDHTLDPTAAQVLAASVKSAAAEAAAAGLAAATGKRLIVIPDRAGQIALRTLCQLANGAADAVGDGVASPEAIDDAMIYGANYPIGPLRWCHEYGVAHVMQSLTSIAEASGDDLYRPSRGFGAL